jgi:hypothetical protein
VRFGAAGNASSYTVVQSLAGRLEIPKDGTLSRTIHQEGRVKIVLFEFARQPGAFRAHRLRPGNDSDWARRWCFTFEAMNAS